MCLAVGSAVCARGQELEPRAYVPYPVGTNVAVVSIMNSRGDVVTDPTLPVEDAEGRFNTGVVGYVRGLGLFGRSANLLISLPYSWGTAQGLVAGESGRVTRSGVGDARIRLAINLMGAPSMTPKEFRSYRFKALLAASLLVSPPTGQYDPAKLINIGTNRWTFKPEVAYSRALTDSGQWALDAYGGVWFFTTNKDFVFGPRKQDPMLSTQFHVNYLLKQRAWLAFDSTFYAGGGSSVNAQSNDDRQQSLRLGGTLSVPIRGRHWLKFVYSRGAIVRVGGDFTNLGVTYLFIWT